MQQIQVGTSCICTNLTCGAFGRKKKAIVGVVLFALCSWLGARKKIHFLHESAHWLGWFSLGRMKTLRSQPERATRRTGGSFSFCFSSRLK